MAVAITPNCMDFLSAKLGQQSLREFWLPDPSWNPINIRLQSRECRRGFAKPGVLSEVYLFGERKNQNFSSETDIKRFGKSYNTRGLELDRKENLNPNREEVIQRPISSENINTTAELVGNKKTRDFHSLEHEKDSCFKYDTSLDSDDESGALSDSEQELLSITDNMHQSNRAGKSAGWMPIKLEQPYTDHEMENFPCKPLCSTTKLKRKRTISNSCVEDLENSCKKQRPSIDFNKMTLSRGLAWQHGESLASNFFLPIVELNAKD